MTLAPLLVALATYAAPSPVGSWRAVLDLAGGPLRFSLEVRRTRGALSGRLCNAGECESSFALRPRGDSLVFDIADYAATITVRLAGDSMSGMYRNVGSRGPRAIPFRAARGRWPVERAPASLVGQWDATLTADGRTSPRIFILRNGARGLEGAVVSNTGDYGRFQGRAHADSFSMARFDGTFIYMVTGRLDGDTLRGTFHAGLRTQTPFVAIRATGRPHLRPPTAVTSADTTAPFRFAFPALDGGIVTNADPQFRGKVVLIDVFGTWCSTCHETAPLFSRFYREYRSRGFEVVGLAYEVTGDTATDAVLVRRYRDKLSVPFPLLLAGSSDVTAAARTLPQLTNFTSFPTMIFLGRDGRVRRVHAGFYGAATGAMHTAQVAELRAFIERLLDE